MYQNCYACGCELTPGHLATNEQKAKKKYASVEHVIPNFCGGRLTSLELLCRGCNSRFGEKLEGPFSHQLLMTSLLRFKLDRGDQSRRKILGETRDGREILVNAYGDWKHRGPSHKISGDGKKLEELIWPNDDMSAAKEYVRSIFKNNPDLEGTPEETFEKMDFSEKRPDEIFFDNKSIGGSIANRAMAKIALNFYLFKGFERVWVGELIQYVLGNRRNDGFSLMYCPINQCYSPTEKEVSHVIALRASPKFELLYAYIELFNTVCYLVMFSENYSGPEFKIDYAFDLLNSNEVRFPKVDINLFRNPNRRNQNQFHKICHNGLSNRFNRFVSIANEERGKTSSGE